MRAEKSMGLLKREGGSILQTATGYWTRLKQTKLVKIKKGGRNELYTSTTTIFYSNNLLKYLRTPAKI